MNSLLRTRIDCSAYYLAIKNAFLNVSMIRCLQSICLYYSDHQYISEIDLKFLILTKLKNRSDYSKA